MSVKIPAYPAFRPLVLEDKKAFDAAFAAFPPENSEYTFTNLFSWRIPHGFCVSMLNGMLILGSEKHGQKEYYPPIGGGDARAVIRRILADTKSRFVRIPENMLTAAASDPDIRAVEDRNNFDYVYHTSDLIELKGRKYDAKRNFIKHFKSAYSYDYIPVTGAEVGEVLRFQNVWCVEKGCGQSKSLQDEAQAVKTMLAHLRLFSLITGALAVEGAICAVCIAEALNHETLVIHALKGARGMNGIYPTAFNEFLRREATAYRYINMEQDLGVSGLRASKESYQPARMVRKFTLSLVV